jgi:signal transduction histidine kinase
MFCVKSSNCFIIGGTNLMNISKDDSIRLRSCISVQNGLVNEIDDNFVEFTGYSREELIGKTFSYIMNDMLKVNKVIEKMEELVFIERCFFFTKVLDFKQTSIAFEKDLQNELTHITFIQLPITSINNPLSFTHQIICNSTLGIAMFYVEDFTLLKANKQYETIIFERYKQSDIISKKIYEYDFGWWDSTDEILWKRVVQTQNPYYCMEQPALNPHTREMEYFDTSITPIMDNERVKYLILSLNNVTEKVKLRIENEKKALVIKKQRDQLEGIMENMSDAIFIIDKSGKYILKNKASMKNFQIEIEQVGDIYNGAEFYDLDGKRITPDKMPEVLMQRGIETKDQVLYIKYPTTEMYVSVSATPFFDQQGNYTMGVLSSRDITDYIKHSETIKAQQYALLQAEKKEKEDLEKIIEMKDEFLSLISHEFKTPMTVIISALQAMSFLYKDQITDKIQAYLDKIKQNTYRQVRLVNNLLDITGANAGNIKLNIKNLDIVFITNSIVESVLTYANQKGVHLSFEADRNQMIIAMDEEKYERILLNLLSNAIKFTPRDKSIKVKIITRGVNIKIFVIDEGVGIPEDKHELIFERFGQVDSSYARQAEGSGIGLSLVKQIVKAMGGNISVDSQVDIGSSFCVEFPIRILGQESQREEMKVLVDERLTHSIAIEFSDIYM